MISIAMFFLLGTMSEAPVRTAEATVHIEERQEIYDSLLTCAAFHTIEASQGDELARASQKATAQDYAEAATFFASDGKASTTDHDLGRLLQTFRQQLDSGEPRAMAEQWTALQRECSALHPLKDRLVQKARAEKAPPPPEGER